jgi:hypothetical protein
MTTAMEPTPSPTPATDETLQTVPSPTYWTAPSATPDCQILPRLRAHLAGLVAALVIQATIALLAVLPALPVASVATDPDAFYTSYDRPPGFWVEFAVIEFIAALVIALAFDAGMRLGDMPIIGRVVLGLGFVVIPAAAIVLGGIDAARAAAAHSSAIAASSWLTTAAFGTLFFGLPLIAMLAPDRRARATR